MSLIPFILELADELHEFNRCLATGGMDVDDFGFGIYPHELQQQQQQPHQQAQHPLPQQQQLQQQRRPRSLSQLYWLSNLSKSRHHPYYRSKTCCNKTQIHLLHDHQVEKESSHNAGSIGGSSLIGASPICGTSAAGKDTSANSHATNANPTSTPTGKSAYSVVNKNGFQVSMNVKQFAPNELTVKTIDNCIVVEGQHEDKEDGHGVISRHFIRKYMLPKGYDPNEVLSTLSSDGILTVKAPPPPMKTDGSMERIVDIQQTGGTVQVQQTSVNITSSAKEVQVNAASAVEQLAAGDTGTLPTLVTLSQQQKHQLQQLSATVESVQPAKQSQPTTKDLQVTHERNGNLLSNESTAEQETEPQTAEQTGTSSNTHTDSINNNNNSILNDDSTTSKNNLKSDENVEKESSSVEGEEKNIVETDNVNAKTPQNPNAETTSSTDAIMAADISVEPMETEEDVEVKEKENNKTASVDSVPATDSEDAPMTNVSNINSVSNSTLKSINSTNNNEAINLVETNGIEASTSNDDVDIAEEAKTAVPEEIDIVPATDNGVASELKINITADGDTVSLDTEVTEMDAVSADVATVADANGEGFVDDGITVGVDMESGLDVSAIGGSNNGASVEDGNDENISENNLMVAVQSPSVGDLVAAADAAILLAKTQCDVDVAGVDDVNVSKPAIATEEIAN